MRSFAVLILTVVTVITVSCGRREGYSGIATSDPRVAEFSDMLSVDRVALGLPALPSQVSFWVERAGVDALTT